MLTNKFSKYILAFMLLFILFDLGQTWVELWRQPLQGDLIPLVLPDTRNAPILSDPFGFKAIASGEYHPNINRFFCSKSLFIYFRTKPFVFQKFVDPIQSLYLSSTVFKFFVFLSLLFLLAKIVAGEKARVKDLLLATFILLPFFQVGGHFGIIGFVDGSVVYTFFYGFPFAILLLFLLPYFRSIEKGTLEASASWWKIVGMMLLVLICSFSSALMPGVVLIGGGLYMLKFLIDRWRIFLQQKSLKVFIEKVDYKTWFLLIFMLLSLYSFFLGTLNPESHIKPTFSERYLALWNGFVKYFITVPAFPILWGMIFLNTYLLKNHGIKVWGRSFSKIVAPIVLFSIIYILMLPLGGYREYRSNILKSDVLIPVSLMTVFLISLSTFTLIKYLKGKTLNYYGILFSIVLIVFSYYDYSSISGGKECEEAALYELSEAGSGPIKLDEPCHVVCWDMVDYPDYYRNHAKLFKFWNITEKEILFYMDKPNN